MNLPLRHCLWIVCLVLAACGRHDEDKTQLLAEAAHVGVVGQAPGITPFIGEVSLVLEHFDQMTSISYTITPKPGTFSKEVAVTYDKAWLTRTGRYDDTRKRFSFPLVGLYANYLNTVTIKALFADGSVHTEKLDIQSASFTSPLSIYGAPTFLKARNAASAPGFDFILIKNGLGTPVVVDTDGNLRWAGTGLVDSYSSIFTGDEFLVGSGNTPELYRLGLNGAFTVGNMSDTTLTSFHHDIAPGKTGYLVEVNALESGVTKFESILAEMDIDGKITMKWDMSAIFRRAMQAGGDDPSNFVRDGVDWFHMNSAVYSPADNSLLVSSRENFVVKIDYATGNIKWLLGDPTKHWYVNYPSLRALALTLTSGKTPIGQHSLSVATDGDLLLFNNGLGSFNSPVGTPAGQSRTASQPSRYRIDETARTAREVWSYERDPAVYSDICSSVYESGAGKYLVAYSVADGRTRARLVGVDAAGTVAFDFDYPTETCTTAFNAQPIKFEALVIK